MRYSLLFLMLVLISTGCTNLDRPNPGKNYYVLNTERSAEERTSAKGTILKVRPVRVAPYFESKELVYRKPDQNFESDFYHQFFSSPGNMLTEEIRKWILDSKVFEYVMEDGSRLQATYVLEVEVQSFYGDYSDIQAPKAILDLKTTLIDNQQIPPKIVFDKEYQYSIPVEQARPQSLIQGWNEALTTYLTELESDLQ